MIRMDADRYSIHLIEYKIVYVLYLLPECRRRSRGCVRNILLLYLYILREREIELVCHCYTHCYSTRRRRLPFIITDRYANCRNYNVTSPYYGRVSPLFEPIDAISSVYKYYFFFY